MTSPPPENSEHLSELLDAAEPCQGVVCVMLTRRCNMTCSHCSVASGPHVTDKPTNEELLHYTEKIVKSGARVALLTGGEAMLREDMVYHLLRRFHQAGMITSMTSNGFWGDTEENAFRRVKELKRCGLQLLTISYDRFHADFMDFGPVHRIAKACRIHDLSININITRTVDDPEIGDIVRKAAATPNARLRFYDVQPVGRAIKFDKANMRANLRGSCNACGIPALTDDGRLTACNGPSYFQKATSPLVCGTSEDLPAAFKQHSSDPYLEGIRRFGPLRMLQDLEEAGFDGFQARDSYSGMCELCLHLASSHGAVTFLREKYSAPEIQAEMLAIQKVVSHSRDTGDLICLNGRTAPGLLFQAMISETGRMPANPERVFGRADVDWARLESTVLANNLSRPLLPVLNDPNLVQWAPTFFLETIQKHGEGGATRQLLARQSLRAISETLTRIGAKAVLLKSPACFLFAPPEDHVPAPGDLDLLVLDGKAGQIHEELLASGFTSWEPPENLKGPTPHHLPPLNVGGIPVEIHTRVGSPAHCLPEDLLLKDLEPLEGPVFRMSAEALFFHVVSHSATHEFRGGYKTAFTASYILKTTTDFHWDKLLKIVQACPASRGFWATLTTLHSRLDLPFPQDFLSAQPKDRIQKRMNRLAGIHLFASTGQPGEQEPFLKPFLLLLSRNRLPDFLGSVPEFNRLTLKEIAWRIRQSPKDLAPNSSHLDLLKAEGRNLLRTWNNILAG